MQRLLTLPVHTTEVDSISLESSTVYPSHEDAALLLERYLAGARCESEHFIDDDALNQVVDKPWGHECRIYADALYDFWELVIAPGRRTSTHCHPHKATTLLVLSGRAHVKLLTHTRILEAGEHLRFHPAAFHSTENVGPSPLHLIELETPRNKLDLVRAADPYGRAGQGYEKTSLRCTIAPLRELAAIPGASLRHAGSVDAYRYSVCFSAAEVEQERARIAYAIPLRTGQPRRSAFEILTHADAIHANPEALPCFLVVRNLQRHP